MEHYVHQVCRRIAAQGYFVLWVAQTHDPWPYICRPFSPRQPQTEHIDGIQLVRLGPAFLYRRLAELFVQTWGRQTGAESRSDVIFECVSGKPMNMAAKTDKTVIPIVFDLDSGVVGDPAPPGPVVAASVHARKAMLAAGTPRNFVITAPFGCETPSAEPARFDGLSLAVAGPIPRVVRAALRILRRRGIVFEVMSWTPHGAGRCAAAQRAAADIGYCGHGWHACAPEMAAMGMPTLVSGPDLVREYILPGETGFYIHKPKARLIADRLKSLATDRALRERMARRALDYASSLSWDTTAGLILAAIENLSYEIKYVRPKQVRRREEVPV